MARKRGKAPSGWLWWLLALVLMDAAALVAFSFVPEDRVPAPARSLHERVVDARSRLDGTAVDGAPPPQPTVVLPSGESEAGPAEAEANPPAIDVYFSPKGGCTEAIVRALDGARQTVLVQAYSFTSAPIAKALVAARGRGVDVQVILDGSQRTAQYTNADYLARAGVPVRIDDRHAIAHDKVMVIDGETVITGSFNFTWAAETRNAENLLVIRDRAVAAKYTAHWRDHETHSEAYPARVRRGAGPEESPMPPEERNSPAHLP